MATAESTPARKSTRKGNVCLPTKGVRASKRDNVQIDLAARALRNLMVEQCRVDGGRYVTVYQGARAELVAAGVPGDAFPKGRGAKAFEVQTLNYCSTGKRHRLAATIRSMAVGYELEVNWGYVAPFVQGNHPAVTELARMLLEDIREWTGWDDDLQRPIDRVAADPRAVDYKPGPGAPRLRVTPEFHEKLKALAKEAYDMVHTYCEVCVSEGPADAKPEAGPALRLVTSAAKMEASHG